jgi:hypothetical protein
MKSIEGVSRPPKKQKRIPQNTDRIDRKVVKVAVLQSLYEVDNPPDHRPQEQSIDR